MISCDGKTADQDRMSTGRKVIKMHSKTESQFFRPLFLYVPLYYGERNGSCPQKASTTDRLSMFPSKELKKHHGFDSFLIRRVDFLPLRSALTPFRPRSSRDIPVRLCRILWAADSSRVHRMRRRSNKKRLLPFLCFANHSESSFVRKSGFSSTDSRFGAERNSAECHNHILLSIRHSAGIPFRSGSAYPFSHAVGRTLQLSQPS
jgi:hypothetical protein